MPGGMSGQDQPDTVGVGPGQHIIDTGTTPNVILNEEVGSIALNTPSTNNGTVYVGYSDSLDDTTGFIMEAGSGLSLDLDTSEQAIWVYGTSDGDIVSFIGTR